MSEYTLLSPRPPRFSIKLRQPGADGDDDGSGGDDGGDGGTAGPPSRLFTLKFTLTEVGRGLLAAALLVKLLRKWWLACLAACSAINALPHPSSTQTQCTGLSGIEQSCD